MNEGTGNSVDIELSEDIRNYTRRNYSYSWWDFEAAAERNGWTSIGMITEHNNDGPVSSETSSRSYYGDSATFALCASNAEFIIDGLTSLDPDAEHWDYGPGSSFVFDAECERITEFVEEVEGSLANYGYLNEDRASEIEWEENHPSERECYADYDCSCDYSTHECGEELYALAYAGELDEKSEEFECPVCGVDQEITVYGAARVRNAIANRFHDSLRDAGQMTVMDFIGATA